MVALGGRRGGVVNYNDDEMNHLFDVMESILPIGTEEWDQVAHIEILGDSRTSIRHPSPT